MHEMSRELDILIIEDNPGDARLVQIALCEEDGSLGPGVSTQVVANLADGLAVLRRRSPDLILLDPGLPDSDSDQTLRELRKATADVPVIVLSGRADDASGLQAVRHGAEDYIVKGRFDAAILARSVRYALERRESRRQIAQAESARLRAVRLQSQVLDALPSPVALVDGGGIILSVNTAWTEMTRQPAFAGLNAGVGGSYFDCVGDLLSTSARERERILAAIQGQLRGDSGVFILEQSGRSEATDRWYRLVASPMGASDGTASVIVMHLDITDRRVAEEALRDSEARYRAVVQDQTELICRLRPDGAISFVNDAFARFFGREAAQLEGVSFHEVFESEAARAISGRVRAVNPEMPLASCELESRDASATHHWFEWSIRLIPSSRDGGGEIQLVGRDITAAKRAIHALREADERLRHRQKMEAVGQLASGVAHDFNNLLTAIRGYLGLARATLPYDHAAIESLNNVEEAARQATGVANALLTFTHRSVSDRRPIELRGVVATAVRLIDRTLPASVVVAADLDRGEGLWVEADPTQLQQVVMNLAINARDAMPQGGTLRIELERAGDDARLTIADTGVGMSPGVRARIFEPFFTTKPRGQGTGLGLSVVHGIITEHNGTITVNSEPEGGAVFVVTLPLVPAAEPVPSASEERPASRPRSGRALLAEDNDLVRGLLSSMLGSLGYEVVDCASGSDAIRILGDTAASFDLLVIDVDLPGLRGPEVVRDLRGRNRTMPVVVVSGQPGEKELAVEDSRTAFLNKPFQLADLRGIIESLVPESGGDDTTAASAVQQGEE